MRGRGSFLITENDARESGHAVQAALQQLNRLRVLRKE